MSSSHILIKSIYILLHNLLYPDVDGRLDTITVRGCNNGLFHIRIAVKIAILSSVHSGECAIIVGFQSHIRNIPAQSKANGITGGFIIRIYSKVILLKPHALYIVPFFDLRFGKILLPGSIQILFEHLFLIHGELFFQDLILAVFGFVPT